MNQKPYSLLKLFCVLVCILAATSVFAEDKAKPDHEAVWDELKAKVFQAYQQGKYAEGIEHAKKAYQYASEHLGKEHPNTLTSMNNLATLLRSQGRYGEAEPLFKEAMQLCEKVMGDYHPDTLSYQSNYIFLMINMDNPRTAFRLLKKNGGTAVLPVGPYRTSEERIRRLFLKNISNF